MSWCSCCSCWSEPFTSAVMSRCSSCCFTDSSAEEQHPISGMNRTQQRRGPGGNTYGMIPGDDTLIPTTGPASSQRTVYGAVNPTDLPEDKEVTMKRVNIANTDKLFADIADSFNKQQEHSSAMKKAIKELKEVCSCVASCTLTNCIEKLKLEFSEHDVKLQMEGYKFSLSVGDGVVPDHLEQARAQVGNLCKATQGIQAQETKLQEMTRSVLQSRDQLVESLKKTQPDHLDGVRLEANLEENFRNVSLVQQKSKHYQQEANTVLKEVAELAGYNYREDSQACALSTLVHPD